MQEMSRKNRLFTDSVIRRMTRVSLACGAINLAQGYPAHFINAGQADIAGRALLFSGVTDDYFAIRFATRENNAADPDVARFFRIYQTSPKVRDRIDASYAHNPALYVLPWTK